MPPRATPDPAEVSWHLDKRVPVALIVTIVLQTGAAIWWASSVNSFMDKSREVASSLDTRLTKSDDALNARIKAVEGNNNDVNVRLARFEVLLENAGDQLKDQGKILTEIRDSVGAKSR